MARALLVACAASLMGTACGTEAPSEPAARVSMPVVGGSDDTTHDAVVSIVVPVDAASPELCSGTVIAPRVVLTAGHCTLGQDPAGLVVGVGPSASSPARTLAVASVVTYPGFSLDDLEGGDDLGAVLLAEDAGVPAVPLLPSDAGALVGAEVTLVGFGQSSSADLQTRGTRRDASTRVTSACSALLTFGDAATNACHGDSGGPLLVTGDAGVEALAAVVSYGDELHCATASHAVRVDRYAAWIADVVAGGTGSCGSCPPPATDCAPGDGGADAASAPDALDAAGDGAGDSPGSGGTRGGGGCTVAAAPDRCHGNDWPGGLPAAGLLLAVAARRRRRSRGVP